MFTHLHVHSSYSLKDGIQPAEEIGPIVAKRGMTSVALSDHGYMGGIPKFVAGCRAAGVKPIIGNEMYLAHGNAQDHEDFLLEDDANGRFGENKPRNNGHFLVLAKNATGYRNLCKLTEYSYDKGFHRFPRIDLDTFGQHAEGLVVTSTCMTSQMSQFWRRGLRKEGERWVERVIEMVGRENFFFEVQVNNFDQQNLYNQEWMIPMSKQYDIPLVLTADAHQQNQEDWRLRGLVQCIGWKQTPHATKYEIKDYNAWMYDEEFALELAKSWNLPEEVVANTQLIANMVDGDYYESVVQAPNTPFDGAEEAHVEEVLRQRSAAGLVARLGLDSWDDVPKEYKDRLNREVEQINEFGYASYFLTVEDYINLAKEQNIPVGPGRGSGAGCLTAWSLGIIGKKADPIDNGLVFERFLNPGRVQVSLDYSSDLSEFF